MDRKIHRANHIDGQLIAPASKSYAQRALLSNYFAGMSGKVENIGNSNDANSIKNALCGLFDGKSEINIGESGLACRLLSPVVASMGKTVTINGHGSILKRDMSDMINDLKRLGIDIKDNNGKLPITICGRFGEVEMRINGSGGSQFLSGLLFTLPTIEHDTVLYVDDLKSKPYVDMTLEVLEAYGIKVINEDYKVFRIKGGQRYKTIDYIVEGDWSSVGALLAAGAVGGYVAISGLNEHSLQADRAIENVLKLAGARVIYGTNGVEIFKGNLRGFEFDATDCPDLFCAMVALAVSCEGVTKIKGVTRLRNKESDRAVTLMTEFNKMGANVSFEGDVMIIVGGPLKGAVVDSHNDHRIAMATAVAALNAEGETTILDSDCVAKSYADFFEDLRQIVK